MAGPLASRTVLVTGGAGFIGSHLVDRLIRDDPRRVIVVDNLWLGTWDNLADARRARPDLLLVEADASDIDAMRSLMVSERPDVVFDLATIPLPASLEQPRWVAERLTQMAVTLAELCREGLFQTLVRCSSSEVYGTARIVPMAEDHPLLPQTPYAAGKAAGDLIVRSYWETFGIDALIVRPFNTYGPRQNAGRYAGVIPLVLRRVAEGLPPVIDGDGEQTRDYTFVEDVADAIARAYHVPAARRAAVHVASGREIAIGRLVSLVLAAAGSQLAPVHAPARPGDVRRHLADTRLSAALLGSYLEMTIERGIEQTVRWYLERWNSKTPS